MPRKGNYISKGPNCFYYFCLMHSIYALTQYGHLWRCPSTWWAPPPSKRVGRAIPVRRVRFPSTSARLFLNGQKIPSACIATWMTQLRHSSSFNLANSFPSQIKMFPYFFKGSWFTTIETKT